MGKSVYVYGHDKATKPLDDFALKADGVVLQTLTSQALAFGDFTDNGDATGYIDITTKLPANAIPLGWKAVISEGFANDTSATMQVGIENDLDKFSGATTASCFTAATVGAPSNNDALLSASEQTVRVTVTGAADFTSINAGSMVVYLYYLVMG